MHQLRRIAPAVVILFAAATSATAFPWQMEGGRTPSPKQEKDLVAVLKSNAPKAKKADACKDLAVYGSAAAVKDLAPLLEDEQLASWARIPLEVIPGPDADGALRQAMNHVQGKLLVGVINSIGVRRDAHAVSALVGHLKDQNPNVASAAAVALGHIGNADAAKSLEQSLAAAPAKVRSAIAEGLVLCAERSLAAGQTAQAADLYDAVRKADVPQQRILEATRGAILARGDHGVPLLREQLRSGDKKMFQLALQTARAIPGIQVDQALAAELYQVQPERSALIIHAIADRKDLGVVLIGVTSEGKNPFVLSTLLKAAVEGPVKVRQAALTALGRVGDASCVSSLLDIAALEGDADLAKTAKQALIDLPGQEADREIVARLGSAQGKMYPLLIAIVGGRRIPAVDELVKALDSEDDAIRKAALAAMGTTVPANKLSVLITQVVSPKHEGDAAAAEQALKTASIRMPDREACGKELAGALEKAPLPTKIALLKILGAVGGSEALAAIGAQAKNGDAELQDASSRLLGEWMTIDAAPVLLDLAKSAEGDKYRVRALRGYIRITRQFVIPDPQRLEMCQNALAAATQPVEQKLVLDVLKRYKNLETLRLAVKLTHDLPDLNKQATQTVLAIARELGDEKHSATADEAKDILSHAKLDRVKLEIVKAEYGAAAKQQDVTKKLQQLAGDLQLISLPSPSFAVVFGGDPAPGIPKKLKIDYRIDGKPGEATFAENTLVILPLPQKRVGSHEAKD